MGFELAEGYDCPVCGERHAPLPLSFSARAPSLLASIPLAERAQRITINADQCVLDQQRYFLRGRILVRLREHDEPFIWGVWAEVAAQDFYRTQQGWTTPGREREPAFDGRLATEISFFPGTLGLRLAVQTRPVGERPHFTVLDDLHPLAVQQREGLRLSEAIKMNAAVRHGMETFAPGGRGDASQVYVQRS